MNRIPSVIILALVLLAGPGIARSGTAGFGYSRTWEFMQGNQYLTGNNDELVPEGTNVSWQAEFPKMVSHPVPVDSRIYLSSMDGNLYCLDASTGAILWQYQTPNPIIRSAVVKDNKVIVVSGNTVYCLDAGTGELIWAMQEPSNYIYIYPIIDADRFLYGTRKKIICRDIRTGRTVWENSSVSLYGGSMTAFDGIVVVQSREYAVGRFTVTALDSATGATVWQKDIEQDNVIATPVIYEKKVYVTARKLLYCLDVYTGNQDWVKLYSFDITSDTVFASGKLLVATDNGQILVLDPATGDVNKMLSFVPGRLPFCVVGENLFTYESATGTLTRTDLENFDTRTVFRSGIPDSGGRFAIGNGNVLLPVRNTLTSIGGKPVLLASPAPVRTITGTLRDAASNAVRARINVAGKSYEVSGDFSIETPDKPDLKLSVIADDYMYKTLDLTNGQDNLDIVMDPVVRNKKFVLRSIYFDFNSSDLKSASLPVLGDLKEYLELNKDVRLLIQGHTDNVGGPEFNLKLSKRRAERVREYLVKNGINENRLIAAGLGEGVPVADNTTESGRSLNRRIEFTVQ